jgi:serine protease Do
MDGTALRRLALSGLIALALVLSAGCTLLDEMASPGDTDDLPPITPPKDTEAIDPDWQPSLDGQDGVLPSVADVVARVKPSVVAISFLVTTTDVFNRRIIQEGGGSGWIIDESGIIVTNAHVVTEAGISGITVTLDDGRVVEVDLDTIAVDQQTDLAVLKIEADGLAALPVGDLQAVRVGDWVIAVGNSLGFGVRATLGIVSQKQVTVNEALGQPLRLIETDAAINPGNSGGPLVNMAGEVIGINEAKAERVDIEGVGWAIASTDAMPIIQSLVNLGYVVRPWLGPAMRTVNATVAFWYRLPVNTGVLITSVPEGSPADLAGLEPGDVVVNLNGVDVATTFEMDRALNDASVGDTVEVVFWRDDARFTAEASLVESPPPGG